jgi:hypothetical protein
LPMGQDHRAGQGQNEKLLTINSVRQRTSPHDKQANPVRAGTDYHDGKGSRDPETAELQSSRCQVKTSRKGFFSRVYPCVYYQAPNAVAKRALNRQTLKRTDSMPHTDLAGALGLTQPFSQNMLR